MSTPTSAGMVHFPSPPTQDEADDEEEEEEDKGDEDKGDEEEDEEDEDEEEDKGDEEKDEEEDEDKGDEEKDNGFARYQKTYEHFASRLEQISENFVDDIPTRRQRLEAAPDQRGDMARGPLHYPDPDEGTKCELSSGFASIGKTGTLKFTGPFLADEEQVRRLLADVSEVYLITAEQAKYIKQLR